MALGFRLHAADAWEGLPSPATPPKSVLIYVTFGDLLEAVQLDGGSAQMQRIQLAYFF